MFDLIEAERRRRIFDLQEEARNPARYRIWEKAAVAGIVLAVGWGIAYLCLNCL